MSACNIDTAKEDHRTLWIRKTSWCLKTRCSWKMGNKYGERKQQPTIQRVTHHLLRPCDGTCMHMKCEVHRTLFCWASAECETGQTAPHSGWIVNQRQTQLKAWQSISLIQQQTPFIFQTLLKWCSVQFIFSLWKWKLYIKLAEIPQTWNIWGSIPPARPLSSGRITTPSRKHTHREKSTFINGWMRHGV